MTNILSPEEREEYDALLLDATCVNGQLLPISEASERLHLLLVDAVKAGRTWAEIQLARALNDGLRSETRRYLKRTNTTTETDVLGTHSRPSVYTVPRETATGVVHQPMLFEDMTVNDLNAVISSSERQVRANQQNRQTAIRLRDFLAPTGLPTLRDALAHHGVSLEEALAT